MRRSPNDLTLYERHAQGWWQEPAHAAFRSLRQVKALRLEQLEREWGGRLAAARVVDLGCGGGLLALPLAERGARVVGVDLSEGSLRAARSEARRRGIAASFLRADLRRVPLRSGSADLVLLSDVLEHVTDPASAVSEAARLLRPGGGLFVNTFDRSRAAALWVVHVAEGLALVPKGTHDARMFVRPAELESYARAARLRPVRLQRESPALLRTLLSWTIHLRESRRGYAYTAFLEKEPLGTRGRAS